MFLVIAIFALGVLIGIHEFGHFLAAKAVGVKVNEFSIGMGPAIWKKRRGDTLYALRCLPIGGYCAMEGEDEESDDPGSFSNKPGWKKAIILVAGAGMNFLLGLVLLLLIFTQAWGFNVATISSVEPDSPYTGYFQPGDEIYSVDGHRTWFVGNVETFLGRNASQTYDIVIVRDGEKLEYNALELKPYTNADGASTYGLGFEPEEATFGSLLKYTWCSALDQLRSTWLGLSDLVSGLVGLDQMTGIVGMVDMINQVGSETVADEGFKVALLDVGYLVAFIAVNLAVMNLLPLPALDGGRLLFVIINGLLRLFTRRSIPGRFEGWVHAAGMAAMLLFMAFIMYQDIARMIVR